MAIVLLQHGGVVTTALLSLVPAAEAWLSMAIDRALPVRLRTSRRLILYKLSISRHSTRAPATETERTANRLQPIPPSNETLHDALSITTQSSHHAAGKLLAPGIDNYKHKPPNLERRRRKRLSIPNRSTHVSFQSQPGLDAADRVDAISGNASAAGRRKKTGSWSSTWAIRACQG
ncbi:hypothetical protein CCMA1212_000649 [Trichoderma ghanense]|uniref:Secreted protein n=1 Tax=Trichoderma ghanense TaxID=65468 RepID=A0ABY2HG92_9HYPO